MMQVSCHYGAFCDDRFLSGNIPAVLSPHVYISQLLGAYQTIFSRNAVDIGDMHNALSGMIIAFSVHILSDSFLDTQIVHICVVNMLS